MVMCSESCVQRGQDILYHLRTMFCNIQGWQKALSSGWHMTNGTFLPAGMWVCVEELQNIKNPMPCLNGTVNCHAASSHEHLSIGSWRYCERYLAIFWIYSVGVSILKSES